ncbi:Auxin-responsive protein IAA18, partial [Mucuna pruriens]
MGSAQKGISLVSSISATSQNATLLLKKRKEREPTKRAKKGSSTIASKMWQRSHNKSSEERKLELRLGPPGEESLNESIKKCNDRERSESPLTLGYYSTQKISTSNKPGPGGAMLPSAWTSTSYHQHQGKAKASSFLQLQSSQQNMIVMGRDVPQLSCVEKKAFSSSSANTAVSKRTAAGPVVGWPPIRSFRKNIASGSSSRLPSGSQQHQHVAPDNVASKKPTDNSGKGLFVKINMDGVPIGRKVDINAYDSYEKLSSAVDELFRGLLIMIMKLDAEMNLSHISFSHCCSGQRDSCGGGIQNMEEEEKTNTGLLVGSGEYTLVYEDNEGDRMLVGDVPWHMFVSTVKRLRVLKTSDLPAFTQTPSCSQLVVSKTSYTTSLGNDKSRIST